MCSRIIFNVLAVLVCALTTTAPAAVAKPAKPKKVAQPARHDPPDIPFRRAPMSNAVRTVHIPLATNLHLAFDTELLRTHTVWQGDTLNLWGTPYHQGKDRFFCDFNGEVLWTMPPVFPWAVGPRPADDVHQSMARGSRFLGIKTSGGKASLLYELATTNGQTVRVEETSRPSGTEAGGIIRRLEITPCDEPLWFMAYASLGGKSELPGSTEAIRIARPEGGSVRVVARGIKDLEWTRVGRFLRGSTRPPVLRHWVEVKNESVLRQSTYDGMVSEAWLRIPPHSVVIVIEVWSTVSSTLSTSRSENVMVSRFTKGVPSRPVVTTQPATKVFPADKGFLLPAGDESYRIERFPVPKEIELGVTGMDFLPSGDLAVCTWLGDVYIVQKPTGAPAAAMYRRFARGLCEPLGLKVIDGDIHVVQKQELTRIRDTDGNGEADLFECISQDWGFTGNYHDFSYGPTLDRDGNFHVFRVGAHGQWGVPYFGWDIIISRDGRTVTPFCSGMRSANGFANYQGDIFMAENQGNWMGAGKLNHLQQGRFYGYPSTAPAPKEQFDKPTRFDPPAVWFPYAKLSKSASGIETIKDDRFGPFTGQMLVGDFQNAIVMRVFLEKVGGEWQGCVWPFAKSFGSGVNRLSYGPDGKLYVGGLKNAAWAAVAPKDYSLDRVSFTGKVPFEIQEVRAHRDGFELTFTQPVDAATAGKTDNWDVSEYRYEYHQTYGSPEFDFDGKPNSASEVKVISATVSADGLKVKLKLAGWRAGYVAAIRSLDVTNADGKPLRHETCWYTLNQIPK